MHRILSMSVRWELLALALLAIPLGACATETRAAEPAPPAASSLEGGQSPSTSSIPTELDCRGRGAVGTAGGLMEAGATPRGPDTPEQAVEAFIASMDLTQQDYVVDLPDAWVLRSDETAVARMDFLHGDGWMVYGYSLCA